MSAVYNAMNQQLWDAAKDGDLFLMRLALRDGANVNARGDNLNARGTYYYPNRTPLMNACKYGRLKAVRFLSTAPGIDLNAVNNKDGKSAFHYACHGGHLKMVQFLVTVAGIHLDAVDKSGRSAFHYACKNGHLNVVQFLVTLPAINLITEDGTGNNAVHMTTESGHFAVVRYLLSSNLGFDVEARGNDGF